MLFGINPFEMLGMLSGDGGSIQVPPSQTAPPGYGPQMARPSAPASTTDMNKDFSRAVLGDTEDVWAAIFKARGSRYTPPTLALYRGSTRPASGRATAAVRP